MSGRMGWVCWCVGVLRARGWVVAEGVGDCVAISLVSQDVITPARLLSLPGHLLWASLNRVPDPPFHLPPSLALAAGRPCCMARPLRHRACRTAQRAAVPPMECRAM